MKAKHLTALLCLTACWAAAPVKADAQDATPKTLSDALKRVIPKVEFKHDDDDDDDQTTKLPVAVKFFREATGANIVMDSDVRSVTFGELKLHNVTLKTALDALAVAADGDAIIDYSGTKSGDLITICHRPKDDPAFEVVSRTYRLPDWPEAAYDKNLKDALAAVSRAVDLRNQAQTGAPLPLPKFEAHRATHLLLVAGPRASVEVVGRTIAALRGEEYKEDSEDKKADGDDSADKKEDADDNSSGKKDANQ